MPTNMPMDEPDYLPARLRAARAFEPDFRIEELAQALKMSAGHVSHYFSGTKPIPRSRRTQVIEAAANLSGLPLEFFTADFDALPQLPTVDPELAVERMIKRAAAEEARRRDGLLARRSGTERREDARRKRAV